MIQIERKNTKCWHSANALLRLLVLRGVTRPIANNVIVNEYPKSGGTWLSQMLAVALDLPFPRNRLPMMTSCVMQCHLLNPIGTRNVVVVWRDVRDIVVSFYFHLLVGHEYGNPEEFAKRAERLGLKDARDIERNLPIFVEALFEKKVGPSFNWVEFVDTWYGRGEVVATRYEDLLLATPQELIRIVSELGRNPLDIEKAKEIAKLFSFETQSGRVRGEAVEGSFLRSGVAGGWKNYFTTEASETLDYYAGDALNRLGYREPS